MSLWTAGSTGRRNTGVHVGPPIPIPQRLSENPEFRSRLVAHSFLRAPHWGDSGAWLSTRVRPTIAECEGVANVSGLVHLAQRALYSQGYGKDVDLGYSSQRRPVGKRGLESMRRKARRAYLCSCGIVSIIIVFTALDARLHQTGTDFHRRFADARPEAASAEVDATIERCTRSESHAMVLAGFCVGSLMTTRRCLCVPLLTPIVSDRLGTLARLRIAVQPGVQRVGLLLSLLARCFDLAQ